MCASLRPLIAIFWSGSGRRGSARILPPLRERKDDLPELCAALAERIAAEMKVMLRPLSAAAEEKLKRYSFPGNVRELRNLLERALILGQQDELQPDDFPLEIVPGRGGNNNGATTIEDLAAQLPPTLDLRDTVTRLERALIIRALENASGVQAEAARRLGVSRSDLGYKVGKYALIEE